MNPLLRKWLEAQLDVWIPLAEDPRVLVPAEGLAGEWIQIEDDEDEDELPLDLFDDYPWGCAEEQLMTLDWSRSMGAEGETNFDTVTVPQLGTLLVEHGFDGPVLLGAIRGEIEDAGTTFLDILLRTNGRAFHTGVIGSAPSSFIAAAPDRQWLVERLVAAFDDADAWESLDSDCPWVSDPAEKELAELARVAGIDLEELERRYDARRPDPPPKGSVTAMIGWEAGRIDWLYRELLRSEAASGWLKRRKIERFLDGAPEGWSEDEPDDDEDDSFDEWDEEESDDDVLDDGKEEEDDDE